MGYLLIICIAIAFVLAIVVGEHTVEYCDNNDGVVYKYFNIVRTLENGKSYHILQSTKDAGYVGVTDDELKTKFHKN